MIYCFDLDGTLCTNTNGNYVQAKPLLDRISIVNLLYENQNNTIIISTARGSSTGINWKELTVNQLKEWNVKYHILDIKNKIEADIFIDDKGVSDIEFFDRFLK